MNVELTIKALKTWDFCLMLEANGKFWQVNLLSSPFFIYVLHLYEEILESNFWVLCNLCWIHVHRIRSISKWRFAFAIIFRPGKLKLLLFKNKPQSDSLFRTSVCFQELKISTWPPLRDASKSVWHVTSNGNKVLYSAQNHGLLDRCRSLIWELRLRD